MRWSASGRDLSRVQALEGGDELGLVDQAVLQREQAEEEVAVGVRPVMAVSSRCSGGGRRDPASVARACSAARR